MRRLVHKPLQNLLLTMPKEPQTRPQLKAMKKNYPPGTINAQVLGNSLYLFTDQSRYLFNCAEGTQRLAHEHKFKLSKLEHVFLTWGGWERVGGLPGMSLTVQDIGVGELGVVGPPGVAHLFTTTRRFIILNNLQIKVTNTLNKQTYGDHTLQIDSINLLPQTKQVFSISADHDTTDYYGNSRKHVIKVISDEDEGKNLKNVAVCYIVRLKKKDGQLLIDECIKKGVPPGPLLGKLKSGEDVTINNRVITAASVRGPCCPGPHILILDCPTLSHLHPLQSNPQIQAYFKNEFAELIVHFTPKEILETEEYRDFVGKFQISSKQLFINDDYLPDGNVSVHRMQAKLGVIDGETFPEISWRGAPEGSVVPGAICGFVGTTGMKFGLRPNLGVVECPPWTTTTTEYSEELTTNPTLLEKIHHHQSTLKPNPQKNQLIFLGTGSSIPNKTRNVSAILLSTETEAILLDCGEGTLQQLKRLDPIYLQKLGTIYISHLHADHHLGLFSFCKGKTKKMKVIAPKQIDNWMRSYSENFEPLNYELHYNEDFFVKKDFSDFSIQTCKVNHCPNSYGVSIETKDFKVTYSGDTLPSENLVKLAQNSTIFIHEATMEDGMEKDAKLKQHSTVSQATEIIKKSNSKYGILTHFSQRYSKIPLIDALPDNVSIAFDNMFVDIDNFERILGLLPICSLAWSSEFSEMEERKVKRDRLSNLMTQV